MDREIKFRAWDDTEKCWRYETVENVYNSIALGDTSACDIGEHCSDIFCQFTGLKDSNGVEIYEGDILRTTTTEFKGETLRKYLVCFGSYDLSWHPYSAHMPHGCGQNPIGFYFKYFIDGKEHIHLAGENREGFIREVIGNVYQNPELLK